MIPVPLKIPARETSTVTAIVMAQTRPFSNRTLAEARSKIFVLFAPAVKHGVPNVYRMVRNVFTIQTAVTGVAARSTSQDGVRLTRIPARKWGVGVGRTSNPLMGLMQPFLNMSDAALQLSNTL
jgi:hypothetical protein